MYTKCELKCRSPRFQLGLWAVQSGMQISRGFHHTGGSFDKSLKALSTLSD